MTLPICPCCRQPAEPLGEHPEPVWWFAPPLPRWWCDACGKVFRYCPKGVAYVRTVREGGAVDYTPYGSRRAWEAIQLAQLAGPQERARMERQELEAMVGESNA